MPASNSPSREGRINYLKSRDGQTQSSRDSPANIRLLSKNQLREALNVPSIRILEEMMRKRQIPFIKLGHRTVRFDLSRVLEALRRLEVRAVGD